MRNLWFFLKNWSNVNIWIADDVIMSVTVADQSGALRHLMSSQTYTPDFVFDVIISYFSAL